MLSNVKAVMLRCAIALPISFGSGCYTIAENFQGLVVGVSDGDTIKVLHNGLPERIRLAGIDCPEKSQDFGQQAKQFTASLCFGKQVTIEDHGHDRYGRTIGEVILPDGIDLNHELVRNGYAWWYQRYDPKDTELAQLQAGAMNERLGVWAQPNPMAPWDYRKAERILKTSGSR